MSQSLGTQTPFTVTCHQVSAQTLAAAPRRGQPVCRTCRFAPCPSLPPSHPLLRTSHCLASGVPSRHHSFICCQIQLVCMCVLSLSKPLVCSHVRNLALLASQLSLCVSSCKLFNMRQIVSKCFRSCHHADLIKIF